MQRRRFLLTALAGLGPAPLRAQGIARAAVAAPPVLRVTVGDVTEDPVSGRLDVSAADLPPPATGAPVIDPADTSPEAARLRALFAQGRAAGLAGALYDNRDRGHSAMPPGLFPQMARVAYGPGLRARGLDYGLAGTFRFPAITLGNSSTAVTHGPEWRSQPRLAMTNGGARRAAADYGANALYVYPEHRDHDAFDYFPAAWPYMTVSQGSSGSDRPFLRAQGLILGAFAPEARARMAGAGLVASTVQFVMRRTQVGLRGDAGYLSGAAHPSAFARGALNPPAAVALAARLTPGTIPPAPVLRVLAEDFAPHAGLAGLTEALFTTDGAVARLWRGLQGRREMVLSAAETVDPAGRALRFHWVLLRGDPAAVEITPLDGPGARVRIAFGWQDPRPAPSGYGRTGPGPMSSRLDVGLFAEAGGVLSAPAFVSVTLPPEKRAYEIGPDGRPRLVSVDYDAAGRRAAYDPLLFWWAPWRDRFHYDPAGRLTGWTRTATRPTLAAAAAAGAYAPDGSHDGRRVAYRLGPVENAWGAELGLGG